MFQFIANIKSHIVSYTNPVVRFFLKKKKSGDSELSFLRSKIDQSQLMAPFREGVPSQIFHGPHLAHFSHFCNSQAPEGSRVCDRSSKV